ncbi:MAG: hypothetical protein ACT4OP_13435 [Actinomycetota bacterium]
MRRWFTFVVGLTVVVITGVAFGLTGDELGVQHDAIDREVEKVVDPVEPSTTRAAEPAAFDIQESNDAKAAEETPSKEVTLTDEPINQNLPGEEVDTTPPEMVILHPTDGQVLETKEVVFEGRTQPGARVFAGPYEAEVNADGGWRIVLWLSPGTHHAVLYAKDQAGNIAEAGVNVTYRAPVPKEEEDKEEAPSEWVFAAHQVYGECSENPPYDVFHGTGTPGTSIKVISEYGDGVTEVNDHGEWEIKVVFEGAPLGQAILVKVLDELGPAQVFEFTRVG